MLARDAETDIRLEVARNLNTDMATLKFLSGDDYSAVATTAMQALQRLREEAAEAEK